MNGHLPPLSALRAFEAAARHATIIDSAKEQMDIIQTELRRRFEASFKDALDLNENALNEAVGLGDANAAGYLGHAPGTDGVPGTADDVPMHGVAPQAKLMVYGVCANVLSIVGSLTGAIGRP